MDHAARSADWRRPLIAVAGIAVLAVSIASFWTIAAAPDTSVTLLLAYAGGMAMLLTP